MELPSLGRSGLNLVKRLSGLGNPGWKAVDEAAEFMQGQVATIGTDVNGNSVLQVCNASAQPVGIFANTKITNFYVPVVSEEIELPAQGSTVNLAHPYVRNVLVVSSTGSTLVVTTNYIISSTNGTLENVNLTAGALVYVTYQYKDMNVAGLDQTMPAGLATILDNPGEIETYVYDTSYAIALHSKLRSNADGLLSANTGLTGPVVGRVTVVPTSASPKLTYSQNIAYA